MPTGGHQLRWWSVASGLLFFWGWGGGGFFINRNGLGAAALLSTLWLRASAWCLARGHPREHCLVKGPEQTHRQTEAHTQTHTHTHRQTEAHRAQSTHRQTDRSTQSTLSTQTDRRTQSTQSTEHTHTHTHTHTTSFASFGRQSPRRSGLGKAGILAGFQITFYQYYSRLRCPTALEIALQLACITCIFAFLICELVIETFGAEVVKGNFRCGIVVSFSCPCQTR